MCAPGWSAQTVCYMYHFMTKQSVLFNESLPVWLLKRLQVTALQSSSNWFVTVHSTLKCHKHPAYGSYWPAATWTTVHHQVEMAPACPLFLSVSCWPSHYVMLSCKQAYVHHTQPFIIPVNTTCLNQQLIDHPQMCQYHSLNKVQNANNSVRFHNWCTECIVVNL
jgi:hypothetical protein